MGAESTCPRCFEDHLHVTQCSFCSYWFCYGCIKKHQKKCGAEHQAKRILELEERVQFLEQACREYETTIQTLSNKLDFVTNYPRD